MSDKLICIYTPPKKVTAGSWTIRGFSQKEKPGEAWRLSLWSTQVQRHGPRWEDLKLLENAGETQNKEIVGSFLLTFLGGIGIEMFIQYTYIVFFTRCMKKNTPAFSCYSVIKNHLRCCECHLHDVSWRNIFSLSWHSQLRADRMATFWSYWGKPMVNEPPKFNIARETWWLEDDFPFGKANFQGLCEISGV